MRCSMQRYHERIFKERLKSFLCEIITCDIFSITLPENHLQKNKQLINLLYYDVKNLTSILSGCIGPKCVTSNKDNTVSVNYFWLIITRPDNHLRKNKQLIKRLYNDVKNLTSILSGCIGPKCVSCNNGWKPLFQSRW